MDLIAGLPKDTVEGFERSLKQAIALSPENITVHTLTLKRASNLVIDHARDEYEDVAAMVAKNQLLTQAGYEPYYLYRQKGTLQNLENTGFTRPGYACLLYTSVGGTNVFAISIFRTKTPDEKERERWKTAIATVCDAAEQLSASRTGALIVFERRSNLSEIIKTGTILNADINVEALGTIFYEGTPLHDGAVIVRNARIKAAGCVLPLSANQDISKDMGTRHRAALGMSENSDALCVVVSEETGIISMAKNGVLIRRLDRQNLHNLLQMELVPDPPAEEEKGGRLRKFFRGETKKEAAGNEEREKD